MLAVPIFFHYHHQGKFAASVTLELKTEMKFNTLKQHLSICAFKKVKTLAILYGMVIVPPSRVHKVMGPIVLECNIFTQAYLDIPHFKTYHHTLLLVAPIRRKVAVEVG